MWTMRRVLAVAIHTGFGTGGVRPEERGLELAGGSHSSGTPCVAAGGAEASEYGAYRSAFTPWRLPPGGMATAAKI